MWMHSQTQIIAKMQMYWQTQTVKQMWMYSQTQIIKKKAKVFTNTNDWKNVDVITKHNH